MLLFPESDFNEQTHKKKNCGIVNIIKNAANPVYNNQTRENVVGNKHDLEGMNMTLKEQT